MTSAIAREKELLADTEEHLLSIPSENGDDRIMWDPRDHNSVKVAKAAFDAAKALGMIAYSVSTETGEATREVIREFDKKLGKIIMMTPSAAG